MNNILTGYRHVDRTDSDPQSILKYNIPKSFKDEILTYREIMGV